MRGLFRVVFLLLFLVPQTHSAIMDKFVGEIYVQGQSRLDPDLDPILNGAGVLMSPLNPKSPPLQTSSGWGASLIWLALPTWSLNLEGGIVKGQSKVAGDRDVLTDYVIDPVTSELVPVIESFNGEINFSNRLSWIALWIGRRGRVVKGLEGWIEAGPIFAKSALRADFLGSFQGPQSSYDALTTKLGGYSGDYKANLFGVSLRLKVLVKIAPWLGLSIGMGYTLFQPRPLVRTSDGLSMPRFDENLLLLDEFTLSNPSGVHIKGSLLAPWSF